MASFAFRGGTGSTSLAVRLSFLAAAVLLFAFVGQAQPTCAWSSTSVPTHQEGLAETVGNVVVTCSGGNVGTTVSMDLYVSLNTNITNKLDANGNPKGIVATGATRLAPTSATTIVATVSYTIATVPTMITISGIRAAIAPLAAAGTIPAVVTASVLGIGAQFPVNPQLILATYQPSLLASLVNNGVPCAGSPLPPTLDFPTFASTSTSSSLRVTEANATAFALPDPTADNGTRLLVNITGYGSGSRVFVPDAIVGSSGTQPTSAGAYSSTIAPGTYTPGGSGQLLLVRVSGADANGVGGTLALTKPGAATTFGSVTEIPLTNGSATVTYEIEDANATLQESAQIPVFVVAPQVSCPSTLTSNLAVKLAPVSTVATATATDPVPRFVSVNPPLDCTVKGDCSASYFPQFTVDTTPITLNGSSMGGVQMASVRTGNSGQGILNFTTSISYQSGSGWLSVFPSSGTNDGTLQVVADPSKLAPGTYAATLTVSAAPYGMGSVPITFNVGPVGVTIQNVGNAASFTYGAVTPGSYAVIFGLNLQNGTVTFNGVPATVTYTSATQINAIVPNNLTGQANAAVIVTASLNGVQTPSNSFNVALPLNSMGIFQPGIVNADGSINGSAHPATRGNFVSIYLTGFTLIGGNTTGTVTANFGTLTNQPTLYAGAQGTFPGLDQVNVIVPSALPTSPNPVQTQVCIPAAAGGQTCSNQVPLYIQ
ncbi:MAG TPA: hypothetical protein VKB79_12050 [Bryobacteraceae bacterium]|nr:hypothetical protein [Bryobacteraceae bacterium]